MRLICCVIISGLLLINVCGCAVPERERVLNEHILKLLHNSEKAPTNWEQQAGFYESNYPKVDRNTKADMLIAQLEREKKHYYVEEKVYTYKEKRIFVDQQCIWPVGLGYQGPTEIEKLIGKTEKEESDGTDVSK